MLIILMAFMFPAFLSVYFCWDLWLSAQDRFPLPKWRGILAFSGLVAATLGFVLDLTFLVHGHTGGRSFWGPPVGIWLVVGRAGVLLWVVALLAAVLGKGKVRLPLAAYFVSSVVGNYLFMTAVAD